MTDAHVLIYEGLDELDAVAPLEVLHAAGFAVRTVAHGDVDHVTGDHGLRLGVDAPLGVPPTLLVLPGGGWLSGQDTGARRAIADGVLPAWVARCAAAGTVIASVCTGAFFLQAAGLLDEGRPVVTHHGGREALRALGVTVLDEPRVVDDGDLLSAGGVTSGIDLALHLVARWFGEEAAAAGAARIEHDRRGPLLVTARGEAARTDRP